MYLSCLHNLVLQPRFVMSYLAVEMAKEMRGNSDGIMQTSDGQVVKVEECVPSTQKWFSSLLSSFLSFMVH